MIEKIGLAQAAVEKAIKTRHERNKSREKEAEGTSNTTYSHLGNL